MRCGEREGKEGGHATFQSVLDAFGVTVVGCSAAASTSAEELGEERNITIAERPRLDKGAVARAIEVQERHNPDLLSIPGVIGTGVGFSEETGQVVIEVYVEERTLELEQLLPSVLEGVPVEMVVTGKFYAR